MFSFPQEAILKLSKGENLRLRILKSLTYLATTVGLTSLSIPEISHTTIYSLLL